MQPTIPLNSQGILEVKHDVLRAKSTPITDFHTQDTQAQLEQLASTIKDASNPEGVGLSFPQIGLNLRGFVTYLDHKLRYYLNPEILGIEEKLTLGGRTPDRPTLEGCLSIPWLYGPVYRSRKIKIKAIDKHGVEFTKTLSSFRARLFLHEYDHLEGILFTDYTLRDDLPLYMLNHETGEFTPIKDPSAIVKW